MEAFVPGYNPVLAVLPLLLSLLPHGLFQLFSGRRFLVLGSSSSSIWRNTFTSVALTEIWVRGSLCSGDCNLSNIFSFTVSFLAIQWATNFLHELCTSYLTEHAAVYTFKIYRCSISQKVKSNTPLPLRFQMERSRKSGNCVSLCYFRPTLDYATDPKCVLTGWGRYGLSERCISDFLAIRVA